MDHFSPAISGGWICLDGGAFYIYLVMRLEICGANAGDLKELNEVTWRALHKERSSLLQGLQRREINPCTRWGVCLPTLWAGTLSATTLCPTATSSVYLRFCAPVAKNAVVRKETIPPTRIVFDAKLAQQS